MKILPLKTPFTVSFTGNPIQFSWQISPYSNVEQNSDIKLTVRVLVETIRDSGAFIEVYVQKLYPDAIGKISIDISTIIAPYLQYYTPRLDLANAVECSGQSLRYKVNTIAEGPSIEAEEEETPVIYFAIKGGMAYEAWHFKEFFTKKILEEKMPLIFAAKKELTDLDGKRFLSWIYPFDDGQTQYIYYKIYLSDGTTVTKPPIYINSGEWTVNCIPAGFTQAGLDSLVPAGKSAVRYSITIIAQLTIVNEYFYELDYRHFYDPFYIIYRNSIGGLDTAKLNGQVDIAAEYNSQQALRAVAPAWYTPHLVAQIKDEATEENMTYKADTGFMSKEQEMKLRDLLLSPQKYMVQDGRLMPIAHTGKSIPFYSNTEGMYSATLTWQMAFINSNYTPAGLMPLSRSCPAVEKFIVTQESKNTLNFLYSLEQPYTQIEVNVTQGANTYTYTYSGNAAMATQTLPYLTSDSPETLSITARTICNHETSPQEYGPYTFVTFTTAGNTPPVAVDDYYQVPLGFRGNLPGSTLDNDYDPDGDAIEALANWTIFDDANNSSPGVFTINAAGIVTIDTPAGFRGMHTIPYVIHNPGSPLYATANVLLNFGTGPAQIFVKWVLRNQAQDGSTTDAWIDFYSDPACTIPLDLTGLGITINAQSLNYNTVYKTYNFVATGTKKLMEANTFLHIPGFGIDFTFKILPGTGYISVNP